MATKQRDWDSTVARIAGNIAGLLAVVWDTDWRNMKPGIEDAVVSQSVRMARAIVAEVERTAPPQDERERTHG